MSTLYRKYRPQTFSSVVGQQHIVTTLTNALTSNRVGQAYLFTGPRGTGKTTLARIFAKAVNCLNRGNSPEPCDKCEHCILMREGRSLDIIEIDAASYTGVDNIRDLRDTIVLSPVLGPKKIYIIDEVHMLSPSAFNALLKTLEEPPSHILFILATTSLHKVPDTIISRCQRFDLGRFPLSALITKLEFIAKEEGISIEPKALELIAKAAEGGMRDAESLLTQLNSLEVKKITESLVIEMLGTAKYETYVELYSYIQADDLLSALSLVRSLGEEGRDFRVLITGFLHFLRDLLLFSATEEVPLLLRNQLTEEQTATLTKLAKATDPMTIVTSLEILERAQKESSQAVIPELPLEIALVKMIALRNPHTPEEKDKNHPPKNTPTPSSQKETPKTTSPIAPKKGVLHKEVKEIITDITEETGKTVEVTLAQIEENWQRILETAKELNASLSLALTSALPKKIEANTLTLSVKYPFHKERLLDKNNRLTLCEAFDRILGSKLRLEVELDEEAKKESPDNQVNPLLSQALDLLGGKVA